MEYKLASTHDEVQNQELNTSIAVFLENGNYVNVLEDAKNKLQSRNYKGCIELLQNLDLKPILRTTHTFYTYILFSYDKYLHKAMSI